MTADYGQWIRLWVHLPPEQRTWDNVQQLARTLSHLDAGRQFRVIKVGGYWDVPAFVRITGVNSLTVLLHAIDASTLDESLDVYFHCERQPLVSAIFSVSFPSQQADAMNWEADFARASTERWRNLIFDISAKKLGSGTIEFTFRAIPVRVFIGLLAMIWRQRTEALSRIPSITVVSEMPH